MAIQLPALPYTKDALEPHITARTMDFHYDKHHRAYVDKLNGLIEGTKLANAPLDEIVRITAEQTGSEAIFNNAAQVWNHTFFWESMQGQGGGAPTGALAAMFERSFGSYAAFYDRFIQAATARFGSGWAWLVQEGDLLEIVTTSNAWNPLAEGKTAVLTCDVWEHAYYLDYQNRRADFVKAFLDHLVDWNRVAQRLAKA